MRRRIFSPIAPTEFSPFLLVFAFRNAAFSLAIRLSCEEEEKAPLLLAEEDPETRPKGQSVPPAIDIFYHEIRSPTENLIPLAAVVTARGTPAHTRRRLSHPAG